MKRKTGRLRAARLVSRVGVVKKAFVSLVLVLAWPSLARASTPAPYAGQCGIPATQPVWAEFGWQTTQFNAILDKP
jgi:hypothetical protein